MAGGRDDMPWWVRLLMIIGVLLVVLIVAVLLTGQHSGTGALRP